VSRALPHELWALPEPGHGHRLWSDISGVEPPPQGFHAAPFLLEARRYGFVTTYGRGAGATPDPQSAGGIYACFVMSMEAATYVRQSNRDFAIPSDAKGFIVKINRL
jgi:hypothetical protein